MSESTEPAASDASNETAAPGDPGGSAEPVASDVARRVGAIMVFFLAVTAAFSVPPIQDAVTREAVGFAHQVRPVAYLLGAPLFGIWDSLSLLSLSQHYAVLATLVALYLGSVSRARRWTVPGRPLWVWAAREVGRAGVALLLLLAF
mgnify:FL=1